MAAAASNAILRADDDIGLFFSRYPSFDYEPTNEVWSEYRRLVQHLGWKTKCEAESAAKASFRAAVVRQFGKLYGTDDNKLQTLQRLCEKLDISPPPTSAIKKVHVNIVDFVDCERTGQPVRKFNNVARLADYTRKNDKIFPKKAAKGSDLLRFLLRRILL